MQTNDMQTNEISPTLLPGTVVYDIDSLIKSIKEDKIRINIKTIVSDLEEISKKYSNGGKYELIKDFTDTLVSRHNELIEEENLIEEEQLVDDVFENDDITGDVVSFLENFKDCLATNKPLNKERLNTVKDTMYRKKAALLNAIIELINSADINFDAVKFLSTLQDNKLELNIQLLKDLKKTCFGEDVKDANITRQTRKAIGNFLDPSYADQQLEGLLREAKGGDVETEEIVKKIKDSNTKFNVAKFIDILSDLASMNKNKNTFKDLHACLNEGLNEGVTDKNLTNEVRNEIVSLFKEYMRSHKTLFENLSIKSELQDIFQKIKDSNTKFNATKFIDILSDFPVGNANKVYKAEVLKDLSACLNEGLNEGVTDKNLTNEVRNEIVSLFKDYMKFEAIDMLKERNHFILKLKIYDSSLRESIENTSNSRPTSSNSDTSDRPTSSNSDTSDRSTSSNSNTSSTTRSKDFSNLGGKEIDLSTLPNVKKRTLNESDTNHKNTLLNQTKVELFQVNEQYESVRETSFIKLNETNNEDNKKLKGPERNTYTGQGSNK